MSETPKWIRAVRCEDIPLREGRAVKLGAREIAIFNLGDRFLAVASRCPHRNGPLAEGIISGQSVVCPLHAWKISLETGTVARPADTLACVETYPVRVEEGIVLVELPISSSAPHETRTHCREHRHDLPNLVEASCSQVEDPNTGTVIA
jgi:nitrite reductase (NADH) small subunit